MAEILLASGNQHKVEELRFLLSKTDWQVKSLHDFPDYVAPPEDGDSFLANAAIKAVHAARYSGMLTMADDSGLQVEALAGAPGIYSARFAGEDKNDGANNSKLLHLLENVPAAGREAQFVCAIVIAGPCGVVFETQGFCRGQISFSPAGEEGFGYDPIFFLPQYGCTMAQLPAEKKNSISHRADALQKVLPVLKNFKNVANKS
jgi:XTP/dITP diphosphohydrolase